MSGLPSGFAISFAFEQTQTLTITAVLPFDSWLAISFGEAMCQTDMVSFISYADGTEPEVQDLWSETTRIPA